MFLPAYGQPLYYIFAFIDENGIIGCCCNDISKEKATLGYFHPIFPTFAWKFNFWPFFTICTYSRAPLWSNLCFYWQNYYHWVQLQWYLRKESNFMLLPLLFPAICLKISIFGHFWPFFTICACSWVTPWSPLCIYRQKCYHWVLLQWNLQKWSYSRLLQPYFPVICLKIQFLAIFGHFPLYVPTHGWPLDPTSAFIDKSIITGCCCNDIYEVRPVLRHGKHQKYCHFGNFDAPACLVLITNFRQFRGNCLGLPRKL